MVCLQKLTPFLIEQSSICLKIVLNFLVWLGVLFLQRNNFLKEFKPNKVGSPPCQEKTTSGPVTPSMYCLIKSSNTSSDILPAPGPSESMALPPHYGCRQ